MRTLTATAVAAVTVTVTALTLLCAGCDERAPRSADPECEAEQCTRLGRCTYDAQSRSCRAASGDCAGTEACRVAGACTAAEGRCDARSDADCAQSVNCHTRGWCVYAGDYCDDAPGSTGPAPCAEREYCVTEGQCGGTPPKRCEITDEGCARSLACKIHGRCARHPAGHSATCMPLTEAHCRDSDRCADAGHCTLVVQRCDVTSDEDCRASWGCRMFGRCTVGIEPREHHKPVVVACVVGSDADCALSDDCATNGRCTMFGSVDDGSTRCVP